jgi:protein-tyrosine-phosphatase
VFIEHAGIPTLPAVRQAAEALREIGIDAADHVPHLLDPRRVEWADVVVATCDDACPVIPGKRYVSWHLPDPKGEPLERVRAIRDEIATRVDELVAELDRLSALPARA